MSTRYFVGIDLGGTNIKAGLVDEQAHVKSKLSIETEADGANVYNPRGAIRRMGELRPTLVKKGATIGANATIICGITIGTSAFIGTGTVVLTDVPDYALMVGNPAKQKGWMCTCGIQLVFKGNRAKCMSCKRKYKKIGPEKIVEE